MIANLAVAPSRISREEALRQVVAASGLSAHPGRRLGSYRQRLGVAEGGALPGKWVSPLRKVVCLC